jgi:hypothetical protein
MKRILTGPAGGHASILVSRYIRGARVETIFLESEFEDEMYRHGAGQIYLIPLFWSPTTDLDLAKRAMKKGCDMSTSVLVLPKSMALADSWTRESCP